MGNLLWFVNIHCRPFNLKRMLPAVFLTLMLLAVSCAAQLNYQERALFLGEADNVCYYGEKSDVIRLVIDIDAS